MIKVNNFDDVARNTLDEWIYFLKNGRIKSEFKAKGLKKANKELDILKLSDEERRAYEPYIDDLHYQASMVQASYGVGVLEGIKKGKEEGRKEDLEEGRKALLRTARNLLAMKLPPESISQITGLSFEEIQKLSI